MQSEWITKIVVTKNSNPRYRNLTETPIRNTDNIRQCISSLIFFECLEIVTVILISGYLNTNIFLKTNTQHTAIIYTFYDSDKQDKYFPEDKNHCAVICR